MINKIPDQVSEILLNAEGKALATYFDSNLNVVPVSSIKIVDNQIWLINYFMDKTYQNILKNPQISLACWKGLEGYQIKGKVQIHTEGQLFNDAKQWIAEILPKRIVKGLLVITPQEIYDVAASADRAGSKVL